MLDMAKSKLKNRLISGLLFLLLIVIISEISMYAKYKHTQDELNDLIELRKLKDQEIVILKNAVNIISEERDDLLRKDKRLKEENIRLNKELGRTKAKLKDVTNKYNDLSSDSLISLIEERYVNDTNDTTQNELLAIRKPIVVWSLHKDDSLQIYKEIEQRMLSLLTVKDSIIVNDSLIITNLNKEINVKGKILDYQEEVISNLDTQIDKTNKERRKERRNHNLQKGGLVVIIAGLLLLL
jgi:hypothetical protein